MKAKGMTWGGALRRDDRKSNGFSPSEHHDAVLRVEIERAARSSPSARIWRLYAMATVRVEGGRYVKFGISASPWERVKGVQTGCPLKIEKAFAVACVNRRFAQEAERTFHEAFKARATHGEWFRFSADDNAEFAASVKEVLDKLFAGTWKAVHWREGEPIEKLARYSSLFLAGTSMIRQPVVALETGKP